MGVSPGEGYGAPVIDLGYENFGEEAVRLSEGSGDNVGEGFAYPLGVGMGGGRGTDGEETAGAIRERGDLLKGVISFFRNF